MLWTALTVKGHCGAVSLLAAVIMYLYDARLQLVLCWREGKNYFTDEQAWELLGNDL